MFSQVRTASIIRAMVTLMTEALRTSETSVYLNETTLRYIPEFCHLYEVLLPVVFHFCMQWGR
jgi:hypothetical protein